MESELVKSFQPSTKHLLPSATFPHIWCQNQQIVNHKFDFLYIFYIYYTVSCDLKASWKPFYIHIFVFIVLISNVGS